MKYTNLELTGDEKLTLKEYLKTSPMAFIRHKAHAVTMLTCSLEADQISQTLFKAKHTINSWIRDFKDCKMASLFCGYVVNEIAHKLTKEQKIEIKSALKQPYTKHGLPQDFWDAPQLKSYV